MIRLSRTIHFNAGLSLWRPGWTAEKNRAVYGDEGPRGYGHNYTLEIAVVGEIDPETSMVVNLTDLDHILKEEVPPTAENVATWIWKRVAARIAREGWPCRLAHLRLTLTPGFAVEMEE